MSCPHHNLCTPKQLCVLCLSDKKDARIADLKAMLREAGALAQNITGLEGEGPISDHTFGLAMTFLAKLAAAGLLPAAQEEREG